MTQTRIMAVPAVVNDPVALSQWMSEAFDDIYQYVSTDAFRAVLADMNALSTLEEKDEYVRRNLLDTAGFARRGISPPEQIEVQRSVFADGRPTTFCVVKHLPEINKKVTITFDHGGRWE